MDFEEWMESFVETPEYANDSFMWFDMAKSAWQASRQQTLDKVDNVMAPFMSQFCPYCIDAHEALLKLKEK